MLKPSLRLLILPLGAVAAMATMAGQNAPEATRVRVPRQVRLDVVPCAPNALADICFVSERPAR